MRYQTRDGSADYGLLEFSLYGLDLRLSCLRSNPRLFQFETRGFEFELRVLDIVLACEPVLCQKLFALKFVAVEFGQSLKLALLNLQSLDLQFGLTKLSPQIVITIKTSNNLAL